MVVSALAAFMSALVALAALPTTPAGAEEAPGADFGREAESALLIPVNGFVFRGHTAFSDEELAEELSDVRGLLTFEELEVAAARITHLYRGAGYILAQAYLPPQEIDASGIVEIAVIEGRYRRVALENRSRLLDRVAYGPISGLREGDPIELGVLTRAVEFLEETPGVRARAVLAPTPEPGRYDVRIELDDEPAASGSIRVDNHGNPDTGLVRTTAAVELYNLTGAGDRLSVQGSGAGPGYWLGRIGYRLPVGPVRVETSYQRSGYVLGGAMAALDAKGGSEALRFDVSYPHLRRASSLPGRGVSWERADLEVSWETRDIRFEAAGVPTDRTVRGVTIRSHGSGRTAGGTQLHFDLRATGAHLAIGDPVDEILDAIGSNTAGFFAKLTGDLRAELGLSRGIGVRAELRWQLASKNLYSSERFSLGGGDGVRAYEPGAASGDSGVLLRVEGAGPLGSAGLRWALFADLGWARDQMIPGAPEESSRTLAGVGAGISYSMAGRFEVRGEYAAPVGTDAGAPGRWRWQAVYRW